MVTPYYKHIHKSFYHIYNSDEPSLLFRLGKNSLGEEYFRH